jgi:hypothetical protein
MAEDKQESSEAGYNERVVSISQGELTKLRQEAGYWKSQFGIRKRKTERLIAYCRELKSDKKKLWQRLFGKRTEVKKDVESKQNGKGGKRGKQPGAAGYGRKMEEELAFTVETIDLAEDEKKCRCCGLEFEVFPETSDCEIIEIEVKAHRRDGEDIMGIDTANTISALPGYWRWHDRKESQLKVGTHYQQRYADDEEDKHQRDWQWLR